MTVEVSPSDLRGRVEPHVRRAVMERTAIPLPTMSPQGDLRRILEARDACEALRRGFMHLTTDEVSACLQENLGHREGRMYRDQPEWAEHVENRVDDLEVELARRGAQLWISL
ncbi:hypothetical protein [Methylobacterium mesophilicum]